MIERLANFRLALTLAAISLCQMTGQGAGFRVTDEGAALLINASNYVVRIEKKGFRYSFHQPSGRTFAPAHAVCGLEFGGGDAVQTSLLDTNDTRVRLEVVNSVAERAEVEITPSEHYARFSIVPRLQNPGRIVARTGGTGATFGLGDLGARKRDRTELTGYTNEHFCADGGPCGRLISNFAISPAQRFAVVQVEANPKIVRITQAENAQGTVFTRAMRSLYYFFGSPEEIYASFREVRNREGYRVFKPKYEWFGVGWEAFGALAWDTNEKTVTENVERYLSLGYPLSWMVVGSGFWPRQDSNFLATTSFGLWDTNLYPHPREFIQHFHQLDVKFMLGLRISFITNGPFAEEGCKGGYFLTENGAPKVYKIAFPRSPSYLLDAQNPRAVQWYTHLCQEWLDFGVDGFKEDLFGYGKYQLRDDKLDPVNAALMARGVYVMGRNGYLGSPMDLHRFEDFNQDQWQDRGPINGLAFAYSGFPNVYPDIVGGTFGEGRKMPPLTSPVLRAYMMRSAQYASVNPSMSMGMGPWKFKSEQVERVMLEAARLHGRLHPYIYSAAVDAFETGFPYPLTPLPLVWPDDPEAGKLENAHRRGYEWMLGPSLLACPLYGDDYATAETRDIYLPAGKWMDFDTGQIYAGPQTLARFLLPPGKTPLFAGGKGIVVERVLNTKTLEAVVYPVAPKGSTYPFVHPDGTSRSTIVNDTENLGSRSLRVLDATSQAPVPFSRDAQTEAVRFPIRAGHNYHLVSQP